MPYVEFANIAKDCGFIADSPKCKAYSELEKQCHNREVELLVDRYFGSELLALHKPCIGAWPLSISCSLSNAALKKSIDTQVTYFLENHEKLVLIFNQCQKQIDSLNKSNKYDEARQLASTFNCSTASATAQKQSVYGFSTPIKF